MNKTEQTYKGTISRRYAKKQIFKAIIGYLGVYASWMVLTFWLLYFFKEIPELESILWILLFSVVLPFIVVLISVIWYYNRYVRDNFSSTNSQWVNSTYCPNNDWVKSVTGKTEKNCQQIDY